MLSFSIAFLLTVNVIVCGLIILLVLMQRPKSEGLGAAFGGGMTENLFGAQTTNVLAKFTRWLGALFFGISLILSVLYARQSTQRSSIQAAALRSAMAVTPAPSATASPGPVIPQNPVGNAAAGPAPSIAPLASPAPTTSGGRIDLSGTAPAISLTPSTTGSAGH